MRDGRTLIQGSGVIEGRKEIFYIKRTPHILMMVVCIGVTESLFIYYYLFIYIFFIIIIIFFGGGGGARGLHRNEGCTIKSQMGGLCVGGGAWCE